MSALPHKFFPKKRLEALTDGIYAVALTLLVLNLKLPSISLDSAQFINAIYGQLPNLLSWLLSFWVLVIYWELQVRLMECVSRVDVSFLRLDLIHLALISLLPFSTSLIGEHGQHTLSVFIYTANLWLISAIASLRVRYVIQHESIRESDISALWLSEQMKASIAMVVALSIALALSLVVPGYNLLVIFAAKIYLKIKGSPIKSQ